MEREHLIATGASAFLKDRLFEQSDKNTEDICADCGFFTNKQNYCDNCKGDNINPTNIPYAAKLVFQELTALGIKIRAKTGEL
ncbi:MAG: hypothetical protein JKX76_01120 [Colwellia sp.]|nr:hypothetical protein [Colwellia sp.]